MEVPAAGVDSYYVASCGETKTLPAAQGDISADVCVIGAGFTGLSSALHLAERGYDVVVLEAERVAWGASGRNGGHAGVGQRVEQAQLERKLGLERAQKLWGLGLEAVALIRELVSKHRIDCDLKEGILHVAARPQDTDYLAADCRALRNKYGYDKLYALDSDQVRERLGSNRYFGGQLDTGSLHLHPLKYALGLSRAAQDAGVRIYENSRVTAYKANGGVDVYTNTARLKAKTVILACNGYLEGLAPRLAAKIMPINNYILATEPLSDEMARDLIRDDTAVQDTRFVINYWKLSGDNRLLFGGGETYTRKFPRDIKSFVRKYMLAVYPQLQATQIDYAWGGTLAITMNRMPDYGRLGAKVFYAQGYSGHGVPTATLAGKLLAEAIGGEPSRFNLISELPIPRFPGGRLLRWPGQVAGMLYYSLRDRL